MKEKQYLEELKEIDKKYYSIISSFDTSFPKPLNLIDEKHKFFTALKNNKKYNPYIIYHTKKFNETKINELRNFHISTKNDIYGFKKLYKKRTRTKLYEIESHKSWGKPISTKYVKKYRGFPSFSLLQTAKKYCKSYKRSKVKFKIVDENFVAKELKDEVKRLTNQDLNVIFIEIPSKVNIQANQNLIKINPLTRLTSLDVKRLKVHEIGVHYMRYFNGKQFDIKILESGTSNYIETEEGLAVYCEELKSVLSKAQMFIYAGRVIATYYATRKSFYQVYQILKRYNFKNEDAFTITYRAKRNISDTSQKGGFTKDYVYFSGYHKIKKYAKKNDIRELFIGKINTDDVKVLRQFISKHKKNIRTIFDEK